MRFQRILVQTRSISRPWYESDQAAVDRLAPTTLDGSAYRYDSSSYPISTQSLASRLPSARHPAPVFFTMRRWGPSRSTRKGEFNIDDKKSVKHTRYGVWDVYEERLSSKSFLPGLAILEQQAEIIKCMPFVWRMFRDVLALPYCAFLLVVFFAAELGQAFMPAASLWYYLLSFPEYPYNDVCGL